EIPPGLHGSGQRISLCPLTGILDLSGGAQVLVSELTDLSPRLGELGLTVFERRGGGQALFLFIGLICLSHRSPPSLNIKHRGTRLLQCPLVCPPARVYQRTETEQHMPADPRYASSVAAPL